MAKKDIRIIITLACTKCKRRNYTTTKNKQKTTDRLSIKKYCKYCKASTLHKETR